MTLIEVFAISKRAKTIGYSTQVEKGKLRFVVVTYAKNGTSTVSPITDWLTLEQAVDILNASEE